MKYVYVSLLLTLFIASADPTFPSAGNVGNVCNIQQCGLARTLRFVVMFNMINFLLARFTMLQITIKSNGLQEGTALWIILECLLLLSYHDMLTEWVRILAHTKKIISNLQKVIKFYGTSVEQSNLDGMYGLRVVEG